MKQLKRGLTIVEVIVALAILAIVLAAFSASAVSSIQQNASAGSRTSAVRLMDHLGRLVAEGSASALPVAGSTTRTWAYGDLSLLPGLSGGANETGVANPALYRVSITSGTVPSWSTALSLGMRSYTLSICWRNSGNEPCIQATAVGPDNAIPIDPNAEPSLDVN